ncbi:MAG TPA: hypothetical protein VHT24_03270 [Pseudacidobacterium sp.]|jgi:hypothetical protein|nr:hypothetical protein [Pseudacidobacterium sp.]
MKSTSRCTLACLLVVFSFLSFAQSTAPVVLHAAEAAKALPDAVFFRGQSASIQARNSAGIHFPDDMYVLTALVDNSGYSSGIQQKYQAYFITEAPLDFNGHTLQPGAYGVGMVNGSFLVMDIAAHDLFTAPATHDAEIKRPTPLQLNADGDHYRLYLGRNYVVFSRAK